MIIVVQYNILKTFIMHFSKIDQTYFIFYCSFINEEMRETFTLKILRNTMLFHNCHIFRVNSKKKFSPCMA